MADSVATLPPPSDQRGASRAAVQALAAQLYAALGPRVLALGRRWHARDAEAAEELVAETFSRVIQALPRFEGRAAWSTWVLRIAMNVVFEGARRRRPDAPLDAPVAGRGATPSERLRTVETGALVARAMASLAAEHRMVLVLVAIDGLPRSEVAQLLGVAEGTVWSRYARARLALAQVLARLGLTADD